jgi:hypothetical protein
MYQAIVIIYKPVSKVEMRYGVYDTFHEASQVVKDIKAVNTVDKIYIEERYTNDRIAHG